MEGDVALDARCANPLLQRMLRHRTFQPFKYFVCTWLAAVFQRLVADGQRRLGFCLFGADAHPPTSVRGLGYVLPFELEYIADTKPCEAGEDRRVSENRNIAGRIGQPLQFVGGQKLAPRILVFDLFEKIVDVFVD